MNDERSERELRGFLAERAPAGVSPVLRARLKAITAEPPVRSGGWIRELGGAWRAGLVLAGTVAVAVLLVALLSRLDALTVRDPRTVGAPSAAPGLTALPFITAPADLFTPAAIADAERRLQAVYATTAVEARLVVTSQASGSQLSAPDGWPERFDRDGRRDRDVLAVAGIAPDGTPVCCLTLAGDLVLEAREIGAWRPTDQPAALDSDLAGATAEFRDVALDRFVRGVEDMAPRLDELERQGWTNDDIQWTAGLLLLVPLLLLGFVGLRRRSAMPASAGSTTEGSELVEIAPMTALADASAAATAVAAVPAVPVRTSPAVPRQGVDEPRTGRARVPAWPAWAVRSDRTWVLIAFVAIAGLAVVGVVDLFRPATTVPLDPSRDGVGVTSASLSLVPIALVGIVLASLAAYARQGRWRRRFGVLALVLLVGWAMSIAVGNTMPVSRDRDRGWVSDGGEVAFGMGGLMENVTYRVGPGEPFTMATTIGNPGALPLTILGLDGIQTSQPNPYVASIVSLGWVPQPTEGSITYLSANAEDASASWPVTLGPGEELAIVIVGRAGPCAQPEGTVTDLPLTHLGLRYRVLGVERTTDVGLPAVVFVTGQSPCTVETPGGTVTFSNPGQ